MRKIVQELLEYGNRFTEGRIRRGMDAQGIVVGGLFFHLKVGIGCRSLFESHACLVLVGQLQVGKSHVQISVLSKGIVAAGRHFAQQFGHLGESTALVARHTLHVEGVASRAAIRIFFLIPGKSFHRFVVFAVMVIGCPFYAMHLGGIGFVGPGRQVVLCHDFRLVVILLEEIDFGDVVWYKAFILRTFLHGEESL